MGIKTRNSFLTAVKFPRVLRDMCSRVSKVIYLVFWQQEIHLSGIYAYHFRSAVYEKAQIGDQ